MKWINVKDVLPYNLQECIVTFVNGNPPAYYAHFKGVPQVGAMVYNEGVWHWYSSNTKDLVGEYPDMKHFRIEQDLRVTHWMPFPKPLTKEEIKNEEKRID